jgi:hypothetical protein
MAPKSSTASVFEEMRARAAWERIGEFDAQTGLEDFLKSPDAPRRLGPQAFQRLSGLLAEVQAYAAPMKGEAPPPVMALDKTARDMWLSLLSRAASTVWVWELPGVATPSRTPTACFERLALLAARGRDGCSLHLVEQENQAFMWKAPMIHPMQARENAYQRIVQAAGRDPAAPDPLAAQSDALRTFFAQDEAAPAPTKWRPGDASADPRLASVRMNHLIDTFYLFRLLVRYQVQSEQDVSESLRIDLSGELTKRLHNGDPARMAWLSQWLTRKVADLGTRMNELNRQLDERQVIFFVKGGRALNFFLGTPEKGENDWDTQVVINPNLKAPVWYEAFARVHDELLSALQAYNREFAQLVQDHAAEFSDYLDDVDAPAALEDEEPDENEISDVGSGYEHASCKAELIDIGIPRRDSSAALEEWTQLSAPGALLVKDGVVYPHRPYYLNEYLMMIREAFLPKADVHKAPKRILRFSLLLQRADGGGEAPDATRRMRALPRTAERIAALSEAPRRELFRMIGAQFAQAYSLLQDKELGAVLDGEAAGLITSPPPLAGELKQALDQAVATGKFEKGILDVATDVGVAHALSERMIEHGRLRNQFFGQRGEYFHDVLVALAEKTAAPLGAIGAQFAVTGAYAARLHAEQLHAPITGLEPIRRIVVHLQFRRGEAKEAEVIARVRDIVREVVSTMQELEPIDLDGTEDPRNRAVAVRWKTPIPFRDGGPTYHPLVLKVRAAEQRGDALPILASIRNIPVLDLRYLVDDYIRKTSKVHEHGARRVLGMATSAVLDMMSQFDFTAAEDTDELE